MAEITIIVAFLAGLLSFLSPCILPLLPGFIAYIAGNTSLDNKPPSRKTTFLVSLFFVIGFSIVFAGLGLLLNTVLAQTGATIRMWLARLGGLIIIFFGLYMLKVIKIPFLDQERKLHVKAKSRNMYISAFIFGLAFAIGWSPCVGGVLGGVLALALTQPSLALLLMIAYTIGLGLPFLVMGWFAREATTLIRKSKTFFKYFNIIVGVLLILLGVAVFLDRLNLIAHFWLYI